MSAFICTDRHIKALALFAVSGAHFQPVSTRWKVTWDDRQNTAEVVANILYAENVRSVSHRYRTEPDYDDNGLSTDDLPGLIQRPETISISSSEAFHPPVLDPVTILKLCDCLEYQSCETDDYRETLAFKLLESIRSGAIRRLPGYEDAPWELDAA